MRFTAFLGGMGERIFTSDTVTRIAFTGARGPRKPWTAKLWVKGGVPIGAPPYRFGSAGGYSIENELVREHDEATGLKVTVSGQVVATQPLKVGFLPAFFTIHNTDRSKGITDDEVRAETKKRAEESEKFIPDYFPMPAGGFTSVPVNEEDMTGRPRPPGNAADVRRVYRAAVVKKYDAFARMMGLDRIVLATNHLNVNDAIEDRVLGIAISTKVVVVKANEDFMTIAHELAHTMMRTPPGWAEPQMVEKCSAPGNYHNANTPYANGVRLDFGGAPTTTQFLDRKNPIMSVGNKLEDWWIAQCTYSFLVGAMQKIPDPPVRLVRGILRKSGGRTTAELWPSYEVDGAPSEPEHVEGQPDAWTIVVRDAAGKEVQRHAFLPGWIDENGAALDETPFAFELPLDVPAHRLEVEGPGGGRATLARSTGGALAVHVTGAAIEKDRIQVRWAFAGEAPARHWTSITVDSADHHLGMPLSDEAGITRASFAVPAGQAPYRVRVWVSDGVRSTVETVQVGR